MIRADVLPRGVVRAIARFWPSPPRGRIESLTGIAEADWRRFGEIFPALGPDPGRQAARARRAFTLVAWHELSRKRPRPRWDPAPPPASPGLFVTAHVGNLRMLRYFLRAARIPTATIVDETHLGRTTYGAMNGWIDARFPAPVPHTFWSGEPHRLRRALATGSLLAAIDRIHRPPPGAPDRSERVAFLGGTLDVELAAFRLARLAAVPVRPVFVTAPRARLRITVGDPLPPEATEAARSFGALLDRVTRASPGDFDGFTHRYLVR